MSAWSRFSAMAMMASALAVVGAIVWSGCGSGDDRYYCDTSGCYSCDGYGCRNVNPPSATPCTGTSNCGAGQVCTDHGCTSTCSTDGDCPRGTVCTSNLCVAPGNNPGAVKECTTNAECTAGKVCQNNKCVDGPPDAGPGPDSAPQCAKGSDCGSGQACVSGKCQTCGGANGPCACAANTDCSGTDVCVGGVCTSPKDACKYNSDCNGGVCVDGKCENACNPPAVSCAEGFTCVKGGCEKNPTGPTCTRSTDCSGGTPFCVGGQCVAGCSNDTQCGTGNYCDQGACVPDTRPKGNCQSDTQCDTAHSQKCIGGICKYPCTDDNQCKLIDTRIGYCGADKVCRDFTEAHPQCTSKSDCPSPQDCVGNVCK